MSLLPLQAFDRVAQLAAEALVPAEHRFYCPLTSCSGLLEIEPGLAAQRPKQWCWHCHNWMCIKCETAWHEHVTCDQNMQDPHTRQIIRTVTAEGAAHCPRCGFVIQRTEVSSTCLTTFDLNILEHVYNLWCLDSVFSTPFCLSCTALNIFVQIQQPEC